MEALEQRDLPSVNISGLDLAPAPHQSGSGFPAAMVAAADQAQAQLIGVAWYGKGQVQMRESAGHGGWASDAITDPGSHPTATGPNHYSWVRNDSQGDPIAYVANSTPSLNALFALSLPPPSSARVRTLQVKAVSVGDGLNGIPTIEPTAIDVLNLVTNNGAYDRWTNDLTTPVPYPDGAPPTY
jgi:hypothetical protein